MSEYHIEHEIHTLLENNELGWNNKTPEFTIEWITFKQWDFTIAKWSFGNRWLAKTKIISDNYKNALKDYLYILNGLVCKISFIWQAYIDCNNWSILIRKDNRGLLFYKYKSEAVWLHFEEKEQGILINLNSNTNIQKNFYSYWYDLINTTWYSWKLLLLCSAIESLVPKKTNKKNFRIELLWKELADTLFQQKTGLRHRISHGEYFNKNDFSINYVEEVYKKIISYFNETILYENQKISLDIVNPQRHPFWNFRWSGLFIKPDLDIKFSLKKILNNIVDNNVGKIQKFEYISKIDNF